MEIRLERYKREEHATLGRMTIDNDIYYTLEPTDRGLRQSMPAALIRTKKKPGITAIPTGRYAVRLMSSPRFSYRPYYRQFAGKLPRLQEVPGFSGILIHVGNYYTQTQGCILVGTAPGTHNGSSCVWSSKIAFSAIMNRYMLPAAKRNESIYITIS